MHLKWLTRALLLAALAIFSGCGGNSVTPDVNIRADINWAERGRSIAAPAAALSCKIALYRPVLFNPDDGLLAGNHNPILNMNSSNDGGPAYLWIVNRQSDPGAYVQHWVSPVAVPVQKWRIVITFTSEANGAGSVVGTADYVVPIMDDGTGMGSIVIGRVITSIDVQELQTIAVGEHKALSFIAHDAQGSVVAISPGSVRWEVGAPMVGAILERQILPEMLRFQDGEAVGVSVGNPTVRVLMDNLTSPWMGVLVYNPAPTISLMRCSIWRSNASGQWIYFAGGVEGNLDIYRVKPDGTQFEKYTTVGRNIMRFDISSNSETIVFEERGPDFWTDCRIMKINHDGSGLTELVGARSGHPMFMDDNMVLFEKSLAANSPSNMYKINITGGEIIHIPNHTTSEEQPSWQAAVGSYPERIVYVEAYNGDARLWVKTPDNSYTRAYTGELLYGKVFGSPCFTSAGSQIIAPNSFRTGSGGSLEISIVDVTTAEMTYPFAENSFENADGVSAGPGDNFSFIGKHNGEYGLFTCTPFGSDLMRVYPPETAN